MTSYDTVYVALAESLDVPLVTAAQPLTKAAATDVTTLELLKQRAVPGTGR